jgi:membrane protease YdiL (CAAX protease family)
MTPRLEKGAKGAVSTDRDGSAAGDAQARQRGWGARVTDAAELVLALSLIAAGHAGFVPFTATPLIVLLGAVSFFIRKEGLRGPGLDARPYQRRSIALGVGAGVSLQLLSLYVVEPLAALVTGDLPDVSLFAPLVGNESLLVVSLLVSWTLAAFGEEFAYRGYLLPRLARAGGSTRAAWLLGLVVTSALFGLGHVYQGPSGIVTTALSGAAFGGLYLAARRNLWLVIVAHGVSDTIGFTMIYSGIYPGM